MPWVIVGVIAGLAALVGGWFWWWWPKRQVDRLRLSDPKARADVEDNFRKTIGQFIGGLAVLFGAWVAYLQFSQQQQTSQQQFSRQQQASLDLLISNQVAKGFEQLGNDKVVVVRLGGIYALEGVMNTSEQYHQPVLEALSAFVRDSTRTATGDGPPVTDIQAALTVIGRRKAIGTGNPNLAHANIPKANLYSADLSGANLSGADLSGAVLRGADLGSAHLYGADLNGADLGSADLSGADLGIATLTRANLSGANLSGAFLGGAFLGSANLSGANLGSATVSQEQLDKACGTNVKLDPGLTLKPC
jgi:uncharacterized protein YjbI with pentapeptide repeats